MSNEEAMQALRDSERAVRSAAKRAERVQRSCETHAAIRDSLHPIPDEEPTQRTNYGPFLAEFDQ